MYKLKIGGGTDFFPPKILKKTPQKTTVFEMDARYATDRFLRLKKYEFDI